MIKEGVLNSKTDEIYICDFPYLDSITFQKNTLQNVNKLVICNNNVLKSITILDGTSSSVDAALRTVETLVFESRLNRMYFTDLPHFSYFYLGYGAFEGTTSILINGNFYDL